MYSNSLNIMKNVILASVLEPIPEKEGCTTRLKDCKDKSKLEFFLIAGVNIGKVFYELAERIKSNNLKQPPLLYDLAYKAQLEGHKNRNGGKINFGIIELLIPIIATQIIYDNYDISVLDRVEAILKNTTVDDVKYYYKFRNLAKKMSNKPADTFFYDVNNLYDYYKIKKTDIENNIHSEYLNYFSRIKEIYKFLDDNYQAGNILSNTIDAYNKILSTCNNYYGLAADYVCIAIYLFLSKYPDAILV